MKHKSLLPTWNVQSARVVIRADLNVPLDNGTIVNDYRLHAVLPTLDAVLNQGGSAVIMTHIGRPTNHDEHLSTRHLIPWFTHRGYTVQYAATPQEVHSMTPQPGNIILLENLRFFPGEKDRSESFAREIAQCGTYFVQDAFATLHRDDASMTLVPALFDTNHKTIGLCVEHELNMLNQLVDSPRRPFVVIMGGGKVHDKLPFLNGFLERVDTIMLCPALVFTFLRAQGISVGSSLVDEATIEWCRDFITRAKDHNVNLMFPVDYHVAHKTIDGTLRYITAHEFTHNDIGVSIGPKTVEAWGPSIDAAGSILYNSGMGFLQYPQTVEGARHLLERVGNSHAFTVIGGGESVAIAQHFHLSHRFDFVSTGGGATLAYVSGLDLPGLDVITR